MQRLDNNRVPGEDPGLGRSLAFSVILALVALAAVLPAAALASAPEWRLGGASLSEPVKTNGGASAGSLRLSMVVPGSGTTTFECASSSFTGSDGAGALGVVEKAHGEVCKGISSVCKGEYVSVSGVDLPWNTELTTVAGATREQMTSGGKGAPGYKVECGLLGGGFKDECKGSLLSATATNGAKGVTLAFVPSEKLKCTIGEETGAVEGGASVVEASEGGKLSAVNAAEVAALSEARWLMSGAEILTNFPVIWQYGKLQLSTTNALGTTTVNCAKNLAKGMVGPYNKGSVSAWEAFECTVALGNGFTCGTGTTAEVHAIDLPWNSELVEIEGKPRDVLVGSGKGIPGYKLNCGKEYEANIVIGALSFAATDSGFKVLATLIPGEEAVWNTKGGGSFKATLEGALTIETQSGAVLQVK